MPEQFDFTLSQKQANSLAKAVKLDKRPQVVRQATAAHLRRC